MESRVIADRQSMVEGTGKRWCGAVTCHKVGKSLSVSGQQHPGQGDRCDVLGTEGWAGETGDRREEHGDGRRDDSPGAGGDSDPQ